MSIIDMKPPRGRTSTAAAAVSQAVGLVRIGRAGKTMVELIAERPPSQEAVDFTLSLAVALDDNAAGKVNKTDAAVRLVHLLPALA